MSLKRELTGIEPNSISDAVAEYDKKIESLGPNAPEFSAEVEAMIDTYPALNELVRSIAALHTDRGYSLEETLLAARGATIAVGVLIEIAEVAEMPPVT